MQAIHYYYYYYYSYMEKNRIASLSLKQLLNY